jgi:hypothetical protein
MGTVMVVVLDIVQKFNLDSMSPHFPFSPFSRVCDFEHHAWNLIDDCYQLSGLAVGGTETRNNIQHGFMTLIFCVTFSFYPFEKRWSV